MQEALCRCNEAKHSLWQNSSEFNRTLKEEHPGTKTPGRLFPWASEPSPRGSTSFGFLVTDEISLLQAAQVTAQHFQRNCGKARDTQNPCEQAEEESGLGGCQPHTGLDASDLQRSQDPLSPQVCDVLTHSPALMTLATTAKGWAGGDQLKCAKDTRSKTNQRANSNTRAEGSNLRAATALLCDSG